MILSYKIHNVAPYINWIYFFHAWGFQPRFAAIANIHGCDVCFVADYFSGRRPQQGFRSYATV